MSYSPFKIIGNKRFKLLGHHDRYTLIIISDRIQITCNRFETTTKIFGDVNFLISVDFLIELLATIGQLFTERSLKSKTGQTSRPISSSAVWLETTIKGILGVRILMNVLATLGKLCAEKSLEIKIKIRKINYFWKQCKRQKFLRLEMTRKIMK